MNLKEAFSKQSQENKECDGDYLAGRIREQVIAEYLSYRVKPELAESTLDRKISEWKQNRNSKHFFFLAQDPTKLEILGCWDTEIDKMETEWVWEGEYSSPGSSMPRLKRKSD